MRAFVDTFTRSFAAAAVSALLALAAPAIATPAAAGQAPPASLTSLGVSATDITVGTPVVFTAGASGGSGSIEYRFDLYDAGHTSWTLLQAYGSNTAVTWTPAQPGTYWVQVWVRAAGSSNAWEDWRNSAVVSVAAPSTAPARLTSYTTSGTTSTVGTPVVLTAAATGGSGSYEYKFDLYDADHGSWTALQAYGATASTTWTPATAGTFWVQVWVRNVGSASAWEDWRNSAVVTVAPATTSPARLATYTTSLSTASVGTPVVFTAAGTGGSGTYEYKFDLYDADHGTWTSLQAYAATTAVTWTPASAGTYWVQVWVRNVGSSSAWEDWRNSAVLTVAGATTAPARLDTYTTSRTDTTVSTPVTFTAAATSGSGTYEYKFDLFDADHGTWTSLQGYSTTASVIWTPAAAGTYWVQVWVRNAGSSSVWEDWRNSSTVTVSDGTAGPARLDTYTASTAATLVPLPVIFAASATSGSGSYEYRFDLYDATHATWTPLQAYSPTSSVTWTPSAAGTYWVQVWVRNVGSSSAWEDWRNSQPVTVAVPPLATLSSYTTSTGTVTTGSPVTFTADAINGSGVYEYRFDLFDALAGTWSPLQAYSSSNSVTWTPSVGGTFWVQVWVRNVGASAEWEDWRNSDVVTASAADHWAVVRTVAGSHVVSWDAVEEANGYLVLESTNRAGLTGAPSLVGAASVTTTSYTSPVAAGSTPRYFRVFPIVRGVVGDGGPVAASTSVTPHSMPTPFSTVVGAGGEESSQDVTPALWDIDGDGCLDMVARKGNCDGTFTEPTVDPLGEGLLMAGTRVNRDSRFADFTGDGLVDIFTNVYAPADDTTSRAILLVGQPDGSFRPDAGVAALNIGGFGETVVAADFDNDGDIDLYLPHYFDHSDGGHSWLLVNNGHGGFHDVSSAAGVSSTAPFNPEGAQALDFDQDGWIDIVVGTHLYINNHDLTFTDRASSFGLPAVFDEGMLLFDADLDGDLDYVHHDAAVTRLYRNNGGHLDSGTPLTGVVGQNYGYGLNACDVNGDGYLDLVVAQNNMAATSGAPRLLLNGGGRFAASDLTTLTASYVDLMACADLDRNGRPDLLIRSRDEDGGTYQTLVINGGSTDTVVIRVLGALGERNQQGRAVRVRPASGSAQTILRFVESGSGYMAQGDYDLLVGVPWAGPLEVSVLFDTGWVTTTTAAGGAVTLYEDGRTAAGLH